MCDQLWELAWLSHATPRHHLCLVRNSNHRILLSLPHLSQGYEAFPLNCSATAELALQLLRVKVAFTAVATKHAGRAENTACCHLSLKVRSGHLGFKSFLSKLLPACKHWFAPLLEFMCFIPRQCFWSLFVCLLVFGLVWFICWCLCDCSSTSRQKEKH